MKLTNRADLPADDVAALEVLLGELQSLADVLSWGRKQPAGLLQPAVIQDVVAQDEFTHDAIVPWGSGALVFGST